MGYITPDEAPDDTICRVLLIPNNPALIAAVVGAIGELAQAYNWDSIGGLSETDTAELMRIMWDTFCLDGGCP